MLVTFVFPFFRQKQNNTFLFFSWALPSMNVVSKWMFFLPKKEKKKKEKKKILPTTYVYLCTPFFWNGRNFSEQQYFMGAVSSWFLSFCFDILCLYFLLCFIQPWFHPLLIFFSSTSFFLSLHFRPILLSSRFPSLVPFIFFFTLWLHRRTMRGEGGGYQMAIKKRLHAYFYAFYTSKCIILTKLRVLNLSQHLRSTYQTLDLHLEQNSFFLLLVLHRCIFFYNLIIIKARLCLKKYKTHEIKTVLVTGELFKLITQIVCVMFCFPILPLYIEFIIFMFSATKWTKVYFFAYFLKNPIACAKIYLIFSFPRR